MKNHKKTTLIKRHALCLVGICAFVYSCVFGHSYTKYEFSSVTAAKIPFKVNKIVQLPTLMMLDECAYESGHMYDHVVTESLKAVLSGRQIDFIPVQAVYEIFSNDLRNTEDAYTYLAGLQYSPRGALFLFRKIAENTKAEYGVLPIVYVSTAETYVRKEARTSTGQSMEQARGLSLYEYVIVSFVRLTDGKILYQYLYGDCTEGGLGGYAECAFDPVSTKKLTRIVSNAMEAFINKTSR